MADGLHNQIAAAIASNALNVAGGTAQVSVMRTTSAYPESNIQPAPLTIVGPATGRLTPGSSQEIFFLRFPMRFYTPRLRNNAQTMHDVYEYVDGFLTQFRKVISFGGIDTEAVIESWDTDKFYSIGEEDYQAIDFVVKVEVYNNVTYTP